MRPGIGKCKCFKENPTSKPVTYIFARLFISEGVESGKGQTQDTKFRTLVSITAKKCNSWRLRNAAPVRVIV